MSQQVINETVSPKEEGTRLDRWVKRRLSVTQGQLEKLLRSGQIRVDGSRAKAKDRLEAGMVVRLPPVHQPTESEKKAMKALKGMTPYFNKKIEASGFVNLGFYGIGQVYVVSTKKVSSIPQMQGVKIWSWEGDRVVEAMISSLKLVSVPLALPDVLIFCSRWIKCFC